ncbi:hypothetical protein GGF31_006552 [Allomyces arbusculus]|nr:hypothetical protein GGF31_006552 [Allomyces arbusculus]
MAMDSPRMRTASLGDGARTTNGTASGATVDADLAARLETTASQWKEIDFPAFQASAEAMSLQIVENQREGAAGRKHLAELTRDFRKQDESTRLSQLGALLKAYQKEIDALTTRSKSVESFCLSTFAQWTRLPDVTPLLSTAATQLQTAATLQTTVDRYEADMAQVLAQRERALAKPMEDRIRALKDRETDLERAVAKADEANRDLQGRVDRQAALLQAETEARDRERVAHQQEMQLLAAEVETHRRRLRQQEAELAVLRKSTPNQSTDALHGDVDALEATLNQAKNELRVAHEEIDRLQTELEASGAASGTVQRLEQELAQVSQENQRLQLLANSHAVELDQLRKQLDASRSAFATERKRMQDHVAMLEDKIATPTAQTPLSPTDASDSRLVGILTAQRDRLKQRAQELEQVMLGKSQTITELNSALERMQHENMTLYERIAYLSSYSAQGGRRSATPGGTGGVGVAAASSSSGSVAVDMAGTSDVEQKYRTLYEEQLNPFTEFARKERRRRYLQLGQADRFTLHITNILSNSSVARKALLGYLLALHLLIVFTCHVIASKS